VIGERCAVKREKFNRKKTLCEKPGGVERKRNLPSKKDWEPSREEGRKRRERGRTSEEPTKRILKEKRPGNGGITVTIWKQKV